MNVDEFASNPLALVAVIGSFLLLCYLLSGFFRKQNDKSSKNSDQLAKNISRSSELKSLYPHTHGKVSRIGFCDQLGADKLILIMLEGDNTIFQARNWEVETSLTKIGDTVNLYANTDGKIYVLENVDFRNDLGRVPKDAGLIGWAWG